MRSLMLITVLMLTVPASGEIRVDDSLLEAEGVKKFFSELVAAGGFGRFPYERAGFLVILPDGAYRGEMWPFNGTTHKASFTGTRPAGTVAVVHTHPSQIPRPSLHDQELAVRLGIPVIILTPRAITIVHPNGTMQRIVNHPWLHR